MARQEKSPKNIQLYNGSLPHADVFSANAGLGCCDDNIAILHDKLASRVRFDNALAHSNPTGANDKFRAPYGNGFAGNREKIIQHINHHGVGAQISVIAIPTYALVTGIGIHIASEEAGLTFDLKTRNGLNLPQAVVHVVEADTPQGSCELERTLAVGDASTFQGFGELNGNFMIDIFGRDGNGEFSLEADELILEVASLPSTGKVVGEFDITISVSYDIIHRAEY